MKPRPEIEEWKMLINCQMLITREPGRAKAGAPAAAELFSKVGDGWAAEFEFGGEISRFFDIVAERMKEGAQTGLAVKKGGELGSGGFEGCKRLLFQEDGVGMIDQIIGDEVDGVQEFIVNLDR